jgi:DHA3 family tetracycline resistance protein-like MFS transporter
VGTVLEVTIFFFEIPTGALADIKSRRLSIIIGYLLIGFGFVLQGALPYFATVLLAQVLWGLGYTFTSGATQAWIADEVGSSRAPDAYLRGAQAGNVGGILAVPLSVLLSVGNVARPVILGGISMLLLAAFLWRTMPEEGFRPAPATERRTVGQLVETVRGARQLTRRQPMLLMLLGIAFFYGLYSEGLDRLWTPHLLQDVSLPAIAAARPVILFGVVRLVWLLISLFVVEFVRRRAASGRSLSLGRMLRWMAVLIVVALCAFGWTRVFWLALVLYWTIQVLRGIHSPLQDAWVNSHIDDPQVRATMFSALSQVDAIGQISGGPLVGIIGSAVSIRAAIFVSGLMLSPVIPLYSIATRASADSGMDTPDRLAPQ